MKTLVIYGCGWSLNELSDEQWEELKQFDSIGVNWGVFQRWIEPTYMLVGDIRHDRKIAKLGHTLEEAFEIYVKEASAPCYKNTIFVARDYQMPMLGNLRMCEYAPDPGWTASSITQCLHWAVKNGYERALIAGVDLYDYRFFFLGHEQVRNYGLVGGGWAKRKIHGRHQAYNKMKKWFKSGVCKIPVHCYNPKSLLFDMPGVELWLSK